MKPQPRPGTILCVGRVYCDLIFTGIGAMPQLGRETFVDSVNLHAGGGGYITAAYLAALGNSVCLATVLPAEPFGTVVVSEIQNMGIDSRHCETAPAGSQPQITVAMVKEGERAFLTKRSGKLLPANIATCFDQTNLTHLHIGELTSLIEHPELISLARDAGLTISLDCGWDEAAFKHPDLRTLISDVDVFLPNSAEAARLLDNGISLEIAPTTIVKQGAEGAELYAKGAFHSRRAKPVDVVDSTGAGDAFNAGFLDAWLNNLPRNQCLDAGNKAGAIAVSRIGGAAGLSAGSLIELALAT